jgi:glycosyltransferase involved in cell wall biosynthesis
MLSVCIPVYNVGVGRLVKTLQEQMAKLDVPIEIVLIDDHSEQKYVEGNSTLGDSNVKYIALPENIGRARIRNLFLKYVQYDHLLFLDCDSEIVKKDFLQTYISEIKKGAKVVCGGRVYSDTMPPKLFRLHWKYGRDKESKPASERQKNPNASFMTNNFVVDRKVFEGIKLDERVTGYGHEDTLFGYQLKLKNIEVVHINNPVLHAHLQSNAQFVENTESAILNLMRITSFMGEDEVFISSVTLLSAYSKCKRYKLLPFIRFLFRINAPILRPLLCSGFDNMMALNFYKLGYLAVNYSK